MATNADSEKELATLLGMELLGRVSNNARLKESVLRAQGEARGRILAEMERNAIAVAAVVVRMATELVGRTKVVDPRGVGRRVVLIGGPLHDPEGAWVRGTVVKRSGGSLDVIDVIFDGDRVPHTVWANDVRPLELGEEL